jgi:co-chaperonin GroES (HSP10)
VKYNINDLDPGKIVPHGDRILVEIMDVEETTESGIWIFRPAVNDKGVPDEGKTVEFKRGYSLGIIHRVGNGHRMDVPDTFHTMATIPLYDTDGESGEKRLATQQHPYVVVLDPELNTAILRMPSVVPMPFARGEVVMLNSLASGEFIIKGKKYSVINQTHVIANTGVVVDIDGEMESEDEEKIQKALRGEIGKMGEWENEGGTTLEAVAYAGDD